MAYLLFNKQYATFYIYDSKHNYVCNLGKVTGDEAERELEFFKKQMEVKSIYRTIVIDPPWEIEKIKREVAPNQIDMDYKLMSIKEIKRFPVPKFVSREGAFLFIWTIQRYLPDTFDIIRGWGFNYICTLVWHKNGGFQPFNLPQYNAEFIIFANKGNLKFPTTKNFFCCFNGERREHSRKPREFYETLRRVTPEPRIDIFNRGKIEGFDSYGYETNNF